MSASEHDHPPRVQHLGVIGHRTEHRLPLPCSKNLILFRFQFLLLLKVSKPAKRIPKSKGPVPIQQEQTVGLSMPIGDGFDCNQMSIKVGVGVLSQCLAVVGAKLEGRVGNETQHRRVLDSEGNNRFDWSLS